MNLKKIKKAKTKFLGKEIIYKKELDSTQDLAKELVKENKCKNGTLVICDSQTNGKGTKGRSWISENNKNITMTIIINKDIEISKLNGITLKIAEEIKKSIKNLYNYELAIKEPNDLLLNNKKICGILTESSIISNKVNYILIGIGFNANQEEFDNSLINIATSLKKEHKKEFEREEIIVNILERIENILNS